MRAEKEIQRPNKGQTVVQQDKESETGQERGHRKSANTRGASSDDGEVLARSTEGSRVVVEVREGGESRR